MSTFDYKPAKPATGDNSRSLVIRQLTGVRRLSGKLQQPLPARVRHLLNGDRDRGLERLLRKLERLPEFVDLNPLAAESVGRLELDRGVHTTSSEDSQDSHWKGPLSPPKATQFFHFHPPPAATIEPLNRSANGEKTVYNRSQTAGGTVNKDDHRIAGDTALLSGSPAKAGSKPTQSNARQGQVFFSPTTTAPGRLPKAPAHESPLKHAGQALKSLVAEIARLTASADEKRVEATHPGEPMPRRDTQHSNTTYPGHRSLTKPSSHRESGKPSKGAGTRPTVEKRPQPAWQTLKALVLELQAIHREPRGSVSPGPSAQHALGSQPRQQPHTTIAASVPLQIPGLNAMIEPAAPPPASGVANEPLTHREQLSQAINRALKEQALLRGVELP